MVSTPGQIPPSIGDQAIFDNAVAGLPLAKAERATASKLPAEPAPVRRRKAKAEG